MSNCIFILGKINKRLLFPLIYIIIHIPMHLYWEKYGDYGYNQAEFYLEYFGCSIGEILTVLVRALKEETLKILRKIQIPKIIITLKIME